MTIKTLKSCSNESCSSSACNDNSKMNSISDMMRSSRGGAVRNLFNTSVDRKELQQQLKIMERESNEKLNHYKYESKISEIKRDDVDQKRRLKYLPAKEIVVDKRQVKCTSQKILQSMMLSREEHHQQQPTTSSSSAMRLKQQPSTAGSKTLDKITSSSSSSSSFVLPKGQRTINDYYQSVKRSRQNR